MKAFYDARILTQGFLFFEVQLYIKSLKNDAIQFRVMWIFDGNFQRNVSGNLNDFVFILHKILSTIKYYLPFTTFPDYFHLIISSKSKRVFNTIKME